MDWISHIIFGLSVTRLAYMNRQYEWEKYRTMIVLAAIVASLFPDLDILTTHRSELHAPLVLAALAGVIGLAFPRYFRPLLTGFLSHSLLDMFLFDNSKGTIRQIIDIAITNESTASEVNEAVVAGVAADGIMLLYPLSRQTYSILLTETTYAFVAILVLGFAITTVYLTHSSTDK